MFILLIVAIVILITVIVLFNIIDNYLKKDKKTPTRKTDNKPTTNTSVVPVTNTEKETVKPDQKTIIYNSELADDLNQIISSNQEPNQTRIQIGNHINKKGNIAQYLENKNYHNFNFNDDTESDDPLDFKDSFTAEDYKKIVALSHIDDQH